MEIRDIRYFLTACEHGTMSAAAEALYISQQALSKSVRKLEAFLGVTLFERSVHGVEPTECARELVPCAQRVVREYDEMAALAATMRDRGMTHLVRMGFACGCFNRYNPVSTDDIAAFGEFNPDIELSISECGPAEQVALLLDGRIDVAYMVGAVDDACLAARFVCREKSFLIMSEHHPLASYDRLEMNDLAGCAVLIPSEFKAGRFGERTQVVAGFAGADVEMRFFDGAFAHIVERVRMNEGIWCAGESFCRSVDSAGLVFKPHPNPAVTSDHYLVYKRDAEKSPALRRVLDYFAPCRR